MKKIILLLFSFGLMLFISCSEEPEKSLWNLDPDYEVKPDPVITSVEPADGVYAGIDQVTINGTNFNPDMSHVKVYFDNKKAQVLSSTATEIRVIAPIIQGDSIIIKVQVDYALMFGVSLPYKVEFAEGEYGGITGQLDAYGVACDLNDNLYVSLGSYKIIKIDPEETQTDYVTNAQGVDGFYGSMKMGPGGELFAARTRYIYKVPAGGDTITRFATRIGQPVNDFDFDEYGDIYIAAKNGIYFYHPSDASNILAASYPLTTLTSVRVYDGYVYVAGTYTGFSVPDVYKGVWRNKILGTGGVLDTTELVLDWHSYFEVVSPAINTITFSEDGYLYIGADSTDNSEAITVVPPNADKTYSIENAAPLYAAVLMPPASVFCWGNDQYLFVNRKSNNNDLARLIRITMGKMSAPYYGRQ